MADAEKQVMVRQRKSHISDSNTSLKSPMNTINKPYALNIQQVAQRATIAHLRANVS